MNQNLLLILLLMVVTVAVEAQVSPSKEEQQQSSFRYVVIADVTEIQKSVNEDRQNTYLEVLMEDKAFSERNLTELFRMLGNRFKGKPLLTIYVYTSLEALRTPEEYDRTRLWGPIDEFDRFKYARYFRSQSVETFKYGIPGEVSQKEVILRRKE